MGNMRVFWKYSFYILGIFLILANIFLVFYTYPISGFDFKVYCASMEALENSKSPYGDMAEFGVVTPYTYPPLTLPFFIISCLTNWKFFYTIFWTVLLIAIFILMSFIGKSFNFYSLILLLTAFAATLSNYYTGNIGIIELLFFAFASLAIFENYNRIGGILFALLGFIKLVPLIFVLPFLIVPRNLFDKKMFIMSYTIALLVLVLLSFTFYPILSLDYASMVLNKAENQETTFVHPAFAIGFNEIAENYKAVVNPSISFFIQYFTLFVLVSILFILYRKNNPVKFKKQAFFAIVGIMILLPRLMPYSFVFSIIPIYYLTRLWSFKLKTIVLILVSLIPLMIKISRKINLLDTTNVFINLSPSIILFLVLCFIFLITRKSNNSEKLRLNSK
jgi:hypothetical protein